MVLGSRSDRSIADAAGAVLDRLGIAHEVVVASAHRDPERVRRYAAGAERRGIRVIIAVAGLAAALPGVVASHTALPVVGVPVPAGPLAGVDALLSMVQLPLGVPVGTVALGETGGKNGALLAARILALGDSALRRRLLRYRASLRSGGKERPR
ncbi:MAG: 5-(carboxyamino)imidazole ribonucleotide mutase [Candidatus Eisenbacteria bacterium]